MGDKDINVLFVDDEVNILNALKRELFDQPYNKFFAKSGNEALKIMRENEIAVIVTDLNMPELNGLELLYSVKENYPDTIRIILSAFTDIRVVLEAISTGETHRFITKPWDRDRELIPVINQSIEYYKACKERKRLIKEVESLKEKVKKLEEENRELKEKIKERKKS